MSRLTVDDERRIRSILRLHNEVLRNSLLPLDDDESKLDEAATLIESIRVKGDAERERREQTNDGQ